MLHAQYIRNNWWWEVTSPICSSRKNKKFRSIVFDRDVNAPASKLADYFFPISTHDTNSILEKLSNFSEEILSCFTYSSFPDAVKTAASVNEKFNTLGLKLNDLDLVLSKNIFIKKLWIWVLIVLER